MASTDPPQDLDRVDANRDEFEGEGYADNAEDEIAGQQNGADGPAETLRELVWYLATNLVDDPESVAVTAERRGGTVDLRLTVPEEEFGRIIGRQGRIARALRTSLMVAASRHHLRVSLDIEPT
jgi:predicted RNA-binding protein YlqC (UPF0109 family)